MLVTPLPPSKESTDGRRVRCPCFAGRFSLWLTTKTKARLGRPGLSSVSHEIQQRTGGPQARRFSAEAEFGRRFGQIALLAHARLFVAQQRQTFGNRETGLTFSLLSGTPRGAGTRNDDGTSVPRQGERCSCHRNTRGGPPGGEPEVSASICSTRLLAGQKARLAITTFHGANNAVRAKAIRPQESKYARRTAPQ